MIALRLPGDKSIAHRALMLAPLAEGRSRLGGLPAGADVAATAAAMRALGVTEASIPDAGQVLEIDGPVRLRSPGAPIDCANSGTTARLLLGLLAGHALTAQLDGDLSLRRRPMDRIAGPLSSAGARIRELGEAGRLPLALEGGALSSIQHRSPVASAQVKSALLFAGVAAGVEVVTTEPGPSRDHSERMLEQMGVSLEMGERGGAHEVKLVPASRPLRPLQLVIPGDFSSAAFWIALAVLGGGGSGLRLEGVGLNPRRTGLLRVLDAMGVWVEAKVQGEPGGEPVGDLLAKPAELRGADLPPEWVPSLLDEIPVIACLAARASGQTRIRGAGELRLKESDRLRTISSNLERLGVTCGETRDGLEIEGTSRPLSGRVVTGGDHRIAMAFGVLAALRGNRIEIDDPGCVEVSYPGFWRELARVTSNELRS